MIIRIDYPQPEVRLDLWGGVSGTFAGLDQFNRIIDQRWQNDTSTTPSDIDRYQYGYDQNSNRLYKANMVAPISTGGLDELYAYDRINRLNQMQRGFLDTARTGLTGTPTVQQNWTLDATGNWPQYVTQASGMSDLDQARTSNTVNEIKNITETTGPTWIVPDYDAAGNMTTMPQVADPTQSFTTTYDAWNRMASISDSSGTVANYSYDGRNRRIVKLTYASGVLSETRHFYFTNDWQDVEERVGTSNTMDKQYVWGVRYIDELVCRDDTTQRLFACQDANFNVTSITNASGIVQERYLYDPYGDLTIMNGLWSVIGSSAYSWSITFQGLMTDVETELLYNRMRFRVIGVGAFGRRDPMGYSARTNLYAAYAAILARVDPFGLQATQPYIYPIFGTDVPLSRTAPPLFSQNFLGGSHLWGSTFYDPTGDITTALDVLSCPSDNSPECQASLDAFNNAALEHELEVQQWFYQNDPIFQISPELWQFSYDAHFNPSYELNQLINMDNLLADAYANCVNSNPNNPTLKTINRDIKGLQDALSKLPT